jgi:hypothetical protein
MKQMIKKKNLYLFFCNDGVHNLLQTMNALPLALLCDTNKMYFFFDLASESVFVFLLSECIYVCEWQIFYFLRSY